MKTIALIGSTFTGNHGAEALVTATVCRLRERVPDARFILYSYYPVRDRAANRCRSVVVHDARPLALALIHIPFCLLIAVARFLGLGSSCTRWVPKPVRDLVDADLLLDLAGISFSDGRVKFLPFNICTLLPAFLVSVPVIKFSQAMGPFRNPVNRFCARSVLSRCAHLFARGGDTFANLQELGGLPGRFSLAADVAFLHEVDDTLAPQGEQVLDRVERIVVSARERGRKIIGVCPSVVVQKQFALRGASYDDFLVLLCRQLVGQGHVVLLVPNATRSDTMKPHNNDLPLIRGVSSSCWKHLCDAGDLLVAIETDVDAGQIKRMLGFCDVGVVSRFHAMVFCLSMSVPVVVVGWGHKYREVMAQVGMEKFAMDCATSRVETIVDSVSELLARRDERSAQIAETLPSIRSSAQRQIDYVVTCLSEGFDATR